MSVDDVPPAAPAAQPAEWIRFPPFPTPPAGKRIIPFTEFRASGIQIAIDLQPDHVELDGLDIPTLTLRVKHDLPEMEQRRKKKGKRTTVGPNGEVRRLVWWEEWEQGENMRTTPARSTVDRVNRLHMSCQDFKSTRQWPGPESGLPQLWEVWRLYIGIISSIQPPPGTRKKNASLPEPAEEDSDDDDDDYDYMKDKNSKSHAVMVVDEETVRERKKMEALEAERKDKEFDEKAKQRYEKRQERKDANMSFFFDDPETFLKIFFSAHFRDKGYAWNDRNGRDLPILIEFFMRFILRNRVFPEYEQKLKKGLEVCQQARIELPAASVIGKIVKNKFSHGCEKLMGEFTQSIFQATPITLVSDGEPDAKKRKLDKDDENADLKEFKASMGGNLQFIDAMEPSVDHAAEMRKDAVADNVDVNGVEVAPGASLGIAPLGTIDGAAGVWEPAGATSAWEPVGAANVWNSASAANVWNPTGEAHQPAEQALPATEQPAATGGWGTSTTSWDTPDSGMDWATKLENEVLELLGPTVLPLTHTTGMVMRSVRRIVRLVPPEQGGGRARAGKPAHPAEGPEAAFARRLGQVVTAPWAKIGNHTASDIQMPQILPDSRGPVVPVPAKKGAEQAAADASASAAASEGGAFDLMNDEFTWLVDPAVLEKLVVGMGVSGTWVQLARRDMGLQESAEDLQPVHDRWLRLGEDIRRGGPGKNTEATKWWYLEQCSAILASFHTDRYYPDQD